MSFNIIVNDYKEYFGGTKEEHKKFEEWLENELPNYLTDFKGEAVELYNMRKQYHTHKIGIKKKKLMIFNNASSSGAFPAYMLDKEVIVGDYIYLFEDEMLGLYGRGEVITSDNGVPIAEFFKDEYQLNILYDVMKKFDEEHINLLTHILKSLNNILKEEVYENSWRYSKQKDKLTRMINDNTVSLIENLKRDLKRKEETYTERIIHYKKEVKAASDNLIFTMKQLSGLSDDKNSIAEKIIKDLDLITSHNLIDDVYIEGRVFKINTNDLIITDDKSRMFKGGKFEITIDLRSSDIRFKGNTTRRGYWSDTDPHPHISSSGNACLGNIGSTIAELCSQNELYALVLLLLDFLQSANTSDPAGKNVGRWQQIDEDGNEIETECDDDEDDDREYDWICDGCDEGMYDEDESFIVYEGVDDDGEAYGEHYVCGNCRDNNYYYDDDVEEFIHE